MILLPLSGDETVTRAIIRNCFGGAVIGLLIVLGLLVLLPLMIFSYHSMSFWGFVMLWLREILTLGIVLLAIVVVMFRKLKNSDSEASRNSDNERHNT